MHELLFEQLDVHEHFPAAEQEPTWLRSLASKVEAAAVVQVFVEVLEVQAVQTLETQNPVTLQYLLYWQPSAQVPAAAPLAMLQVFVFAQSEFALQVET